MSDGMLMGIVGLGGILIGAFASLAVMFFHTPKDMDQLHGQRLNELDRKIDGEVSGLDQRINNLFNEHNLLARTFAQVHGRHDQNLSELTRSVQDLARRFEGMSARLEQLMERLNGRHQP